jgi:heat shock protein HslJ
MRTPSAALPLVLAMLAGCTAMPQAPEVPSLDGTAWVLSALPGTALAAAAPATLRFEEGRAAGSDGCNRYTVGYSASGTALQFPGRAASTQMACPPAVMEQAQAFMDALLGARAYRIEGGRLQLLSADGTVRATLAPQSQTLAGTGWRVTAINNGRGAVVSVAAGSTVTMSFVADGRAAGSAGCNQYTAGYEAAGSGLRFTTPASTRRMCADEAVMQQERNFLKALESVATVRMEGNRLEMRDAGGSLMVSAIRAGG